MKQKKLTTAISKCIAIGVIGIQAAQAGNSITVDSISDQPEPGLTTLREAIEQSNNISGAEINFDTEVFSEPQTLTLQNGELLISSSMTINGPGKDTLTIDGQDLSRILTIDDGTDDLTDVEINGLTLTNGNGQSPAETRVGGCVLSFEALTLNDSTVTSCQSSGRGGGVFTRFGSLNLNKSTISGNRAGNDGGALYFREASAVITRSTISGNTAISSGGGIFVLRYSDVEILNSTLSNNQTLNPTIDHGGGIFVANFSSSLKIENSTVLNNTGEGVFLNQSSLININNSIIAGNSTGDCDFTQINASSLNQNNLDTDGSCDVEAINHTTVIDPMMGALADNGGFTLTHLPLSGSPVIDSGDDTLCLEFDQRGRIRPQDGDEDGSAVCDIGAVEVGDLTDLIFKDGFDN